MLLSCPNGQCSGYEQQRVELEVRVEFATKSLCEVIDVSDTVIENSKALLMYGEPVSLDMAQGILEESGHLRFIQLHDSEAKRITVALGSKNVVAKPVDLTELVARKRNMLEARAYQVHRSELDVERN